jgi:hypothetical protein
VLRAVRAGWSSFQSDPAASIEAQARFARRIGHGDRIVIEGETWNIVGIVKGDDDAPVIIENGRIHRSVASLDLERVEAAAKLVDSVDGEPEVGTPTVVRTSVPVGAALGALPEESVPVSVKQHFSRRYGAVDLSQAVESRSRDVAEEELHREKAELKGVSGFLLRIVKHNIGYELTRQLGINRARAKILKEKDVYAHEGSTRQEREAAAGVVMNRFLAEHDEFLHQEGKNGERRHVFGDSANEKAVRQQLNDLVREYAVSPTMTEDELDERKHRIFQEAKKLAGEVKGDGVMYADNLKEIAEEVRVAARHAGGIDNLDIDLEFVLGKAKLGARTEHEKGMVDSVLEKMQSWGQRHSSIGAVVGAFRNEISVAVAATVGFGTALARTALSSNAAKVLTFGGSGLVTGLYSWWKEKGMVNRERALHERQMALGGNVNTNIDDVHRSAIKEQRAALTAEYNATSVLRPMKRIELMRRIDALAPAEKPRRATMESFAMARVNAKDLITGGRGFLTSEGALKPDIDHAFVIQKLTEMDARVRVSNVENVDLLRYSSVVAAEQERCDLDEVRMQLKAALRAASPEFQKKYDEAYRLTSGALYENEESGVKVTNEKFAAYAQRRARKVGATTALIGAGVGYVAHEVWALASENDTVTGSLGRAASWLKGYLLNETAPLGVPNVEHIAGGVLHTPQGTDLVPQADGSFVLESVADGRVLASGIHIDSKGVLDAGSKAMLERLGTSVVERDIVTSHSQTVLDRVGVRAWLNQHAPDVTRIKRDLWLGNDTPAPEFDFNEQGLDWGKVAGVNANGDFVMDMSSMTADGSWQGATHVDALSEMAAGKMRLVLTMSEGTQNHAIEIVIDAHGHAIIPANSDIARTFFAVENGKAVFLGKFAEVAVTKGFDDHGTDHLMILATHVGKGLKEGVVAREIGESVTHHVTEIGLPARPPELVLPPIIPIRGRRPLERLSPRRGEKEVELEQAPEPSPEPAPVFSPVSVNEESSEAVAEREAVNYAELLRGVIRENGAADACRRLLETVRDAKDGTMLDRVNALVQTALDDLDVYGMAMKYLVEYTYKHHLRGERFFKHPTKNETLFVDDDGELISFKGKIATISQGLQGEGTNYIASLDEYEVLTGVNKGRIFHGSLSAAHRGGVEYRPLRGPGGAIEVPEEPSAVTTEAPAVAPISRSPKPALTPPKMRRESAVTAPEEPSAVSTEAPAVAPGSNSSKPVLAPPKMRKKSAEAPVPGQSPMATKMGGSS